MQLPSFLQVALVFSGVALGRLNPNLFQHGALPKRVVEAAPTNRMQSRASTAPLFLTNKTQPFAVNGSNLPLVDWDIGESYSGFLPVSNASNETIELFFWFFPSPNPNATDEITLWFTGGPWCSSMYGALQEHGPFTWFEGTFRPARNVFSWNQLTNIIYIDQPAGTGFSRGPSGTKNVIESTQQVLGFYRNFMDTFGTRGRKTYITGESYGGHYVSYTGAAMLDAPDAADFNVQGGLMVNPFFGNRIAVDQIATMPFVDRFFNILGLFDGVKDQYDQGGDAVQDYYTRIKEIDVGCGFQAMREKYLTFPPPQEIFPTPDPSLLCYPQAPFGEAMDVLRPCWSRYDILKTCPGASDPLLGFTTEPTVDNASTPLGFTKADWQGYLNLPEVRRALHVLDTDHPWTDCLGNAEWDLDASPNPLWNGALQRLIEATNNTYIASGNLDVTCYTNGTLYALQNFTWNGLQGFQKEPNGKGILLPRTYSDWSSASASGKIGAYGEERGLTFASFFLGTHMVPASQQGGAYRLVERMLGRIPRDLDIVGTEFTGMLTDITTPPTTEA